MPRKIINTKPRGGARKGAGRPRVSSGTYNIRITPLQRACIEALGGAAWIRAQIDQHAKEIDHDRPDESRPLPAAGQPAPD